MYAIFLITPLWGCHTGTLVFNGERLIAIQNLRAGDSILSLQKNAAPVICPIHMQTRAPDQHPVVEIVFHGGEKVLVVESQKFFLNRRNDWITAGHISIGDHVMRIDGSPCEITSVRKLPGLHTVYHLDVGEPHTFFISRLCIMTHNMEFAAATNLSLAMKSSLIGISGSTLSTLLAALTSLPVFPAIAASAAGIALGSALYFCCASSKKRPKEVSTAREQIMKSADALTYNIIIPPQKNTITRDYESQVVFMTAGPPQQTAPVTKTTVDAGAENVPNTDETIIFHKQHDDNPNKVITETHAKVLKCYCPCTCACHNPRRSSREGECNNVECEKKHNCGRYGMKSDHPNNGSRDGFKSAGLNNETGQMELDRAIPVDKDGKAMLSVYKHFLTIFRVTRNHIIPSKRLYHGYTIDLKTEWDSVEVAFQRAAQKFKLVDSKGKPISDMECLNQNKQPKELLKKGYCCSCRIKVE